MAISTRRANAGNDGINANLINIYSIKRLRQELESRGLSTNGTKDVLADRLYNDMMGIQPQAKKQRKKKAKKDKVKSQTDNSKMAEQFNSPIPSPLTAARERLSTILLNSRQNATVMRRPDGTHYMLLEEGTPTPFWPISGHETTPIQVAQRPIPQIPVIRRVSAPRILPQAPKDAPPHRAIKQSLLRSCPSHQPVRRLEVVPKNEKIKVSGSVITIL